MKKKSILILIFFFVQYNSVAQSTDFEMRKSIYEKAKSYNDPNVAISALYNMVAIQPDNILLKDSLMRVLSLIQWAPTYMISREIYLFNQIIILLWRFHVSLQNLGLKQEALNEYESLYLEQIELMYCTLLPHFNLN